MYHPKETMKVIGEQGTKVLRLFRSAAGLHTSGALVVSENQKRPETYIVGSMRIHEVDAQKAFVRVVSNSDKWKAGGAY